MPSTQLPWSTPNLWTKTSRIWLDDKEVKQTIFSLEEKLEGMFTEYEYMDKPIKMRQQNILELYRKLWISYTSTCLCLHSLLPPKSKTNLQKYSLNPNSHLFQLHSSNNWNLFPWTKDWIPSYSYHWSGQILQPNVPHFGHIPKFHRSKTSPLAFISWTQILQLNVPTSTSHYWIHQKIKNTSAKITWRSRFITKPKIHLATRNYYICLILTNQNLDDDFTIQLKYILDPLFLMLEKSFPGLHALKLVQFVLQIPIIPSNPVFFIVSNVIVLITWSGIVLIINVDSVKK